MADKKRILILSGGYAGVWAGKILERSTGSGTTWKSPWWTRSPSTP